MEPRGAVSRISGPMILVTIGLTGLAAFVLLPTVSDLWSLLRLASGKACQRSLSGARTPPSFLFLVPAHNEEVLIASCLESLRGQTVPATSIRVVVVADNCSDGTAEIARSSGVQVLERTDTDHRGKPKAIAWALGRIDFSPFDALVIVDADTEVAPDFAERLAEAGSLRDRVLQPFIGVQNPDENALTRMAAVHERVVHGLSYRLKERVGLNVPLGVGMCIGAGVLATLGEWPALSLGEDIELYLILTGMGIRIQAVPAARIVAQETSSLQQSAAQRHRWTTGRIQVLRRYGASLLRNSKVGLHQRLDTLAEVSSFGPVVFLGLAMSGILLTVALRPPADTALLVAFALSLLRLALYTVAAIVGDPDPWKAARAFSYLPVYAVWRNWTLLKGLVLPGTGEWKRTERHTPGKGR